MTRSKKVVMNLLSEILPQIIIMILGLVKSKYYLDYLGENTVGLVNLFIQIIGYLSIVEGGIGQAIIYRLYNPTSKKNYKLVSKIRNGTKKIFKKIMIIIFSLSIIVGFIIPFLIKDNQFDISFIVFNFILYVISEIILYTTVFERSIYIATEKSYKVNRIIKSSLIIKHIFEILFAVLFKNITIILFCLIVLSIIENLIIKIMANKDFPEISNTDEEDMSVLTDVKALLVHKIAGLVATNIDIVLISKFIGLGKVLIYSTYLLYEGSIISLTNKISRAMVGTVGNILIEKKKNAYNSFVKFNGYCFFLAMIIAGPFNLFINNFIEIFYNGKVATSIITASLFTGVLIYNIIRIPLMTYTEGAGLFKKTKICPILESIINLILSIILVNICGINGCLVGTVVSLFISEYLIKPNIIYKNIFKEKVKNYYLMNMKFIIIIGIQMAISILLSYHLSFNGLLNLLVCLALYGIINMALIIVIFKMLKQDYIFDILKVFKRGDYSHEKEK